MAKRKPPAPIPASCRADGRKHDTGLERPYRPKPSDFRETYISMGWDGIEEHYGTNWRVIRRWVEEEGRDGLRAARAKHVRELYAERRIEAGDRRRRYCLGRTLKHAGKASKGDAQLHPGLTRNQSRDLGPDVVFDLKIDNEDMSDLTAVKVRGGGE